MDFDLKYVVLRFIMLLSFLNRYSLFDASPKTSDNHLSVSLMNSTQGERKKKFSLEFRLKKHSIVGGSGERKKRAFDCRRKKMTSK